MQDRAEDTPLFLTNRHAAHTPRRVQQIIGEYAAQAKVKATPHTFRHQCLTILTAEGMTDAELQLISGHSRKDTLGIYQHLGMSPAIRAKYEAAMGKQ